MGTMYANAQELLAEKNSDGVTIRRWNDDYTEIVLKTPEELATDLGKLRLTLVNEHGIHLWKQVSTQVVPRSQQEIDADEFTWRENNFNTPIFFGRLIQEFDTERWFALSKIGVGWTMQQLIQYPNFSGLKTYANSLIADGTITQQDAVIINTCLLEQGINLNDY